MLFAACRYAGLAPVVMPASKKFSNAGGLMIRKSARGFFHPLLEMMPFPDRLLVGLGP